MPRESSLGPSITRFLTPSGNGPSMAGERLRARRLDASKAALNSVTLEFSKELRDTPIKVNAADPGYCATDMNGHQGYRSPEQGAVAAVRLATLADDGPSGAFFNDEGPVPW